MHVGRSHDEQMGNRAQRGEVFDWLMRRAVFAQSDRVVRENINYLHFRKRGQTDRRTHIVGKRHERPAVGNQSAAERYARHRRAHRVFAHAKVNDAAVVANSFKAAAVFDVRIVRHAQIGRTANQHRQMRRQGIDDLAAGNARGDGFRILERRKMIFPTIG